MANFSLVTVSRGEIKSVDGFIKTFNSIGHNMKVLAVSAYAFLTSEDKELSIEFGKRVRDELNMSKATLSNLRTAGWLYSLGDIFEPFSYTNVVLFKKNVEELKDENDVIDIANLYKFIVELALTADSRIELKGECLEDDATQASYFLSSLSQKELKHIIEVYNTPVAEATVSDVTEKPVEEAVEEVVEEAIEEAKESIEEATFYNIIDDDFAEIMNTLTVMINEKSLSKKELVEYASTVYNRLSRYAE